MHDTECPYWNQVALNNTELKLKTTFPMLIPKFVVTQYAVHMHRTKLSNGMLKICHCTEQW